MYISAFSFYLLDSCVTSKENKETHNLGALRLVAKQKPKACVLIVNTPCFTKRKIACVLAKSNRPPASTKWIRSNSCLSTRMRWITYNPITIN